MFMFTVMRCDASTVLCAAVTDVHAFVAVNIVDCKLYVLANCSSVRYLDGYVVEK